jgi:hypothetical protein
MSRGLKKRGLAQTALMAADARQKKLNLVDLPV